MRELPAYGAATLIGLVGIAHAVPTRQVGLSAALLVAASPPEGGPLLPPRAAAR
ncbi:hypothetical protein OIE68_04455 [Nocardia vinacea]|uniref:hypothetical protein n=1 Tax=Nocardia vinacea TaxID=96468 RepID=UPI002E0F0CAB|nr:hypothetical protein OIE68_04455 [Nocardia vinacea]